MDAFQSVSIDPPNVTLEYGAGESVSACISVTNTGSAKIDTTIEECLTVRPAGAVGRAVKTAFQNRQRDFAGKLVLLGETMAGETSLDLAVTSRASFEQLKAGAQGRIDLVIELPENINTETNWTGQLALLGERLPITLKVRSQAA